MRNSANSHCPLGGASVPRTWLRFIKMPDRMKEVEWKNTCLTIHCKNYQC